LSAEIVQRTLAHAEHDIVVVLVIAVLLLFVVNWNCPALQLRECTSRIAY
jgi:hypothetical protein